jgi:hypothetical protein
MCGAQVDPRCRFVVEVCAGFDVVLIFCFPARRVLLSCNVYASHRDLLLVVVVRCNMVVDFDLCVDSFEAEALISIKPP